MSATNNTYVISADKIPDAIQWHEGMLLSPQHFQQQAARFESLLQYQTATVNPFYWGVRQFEKEFSNSKLTVKKLEAIMPDGLVISYDKDKDDKLELDLLAEPVNDGDSQPNPQKANSLLICLAVPPNRAARIDDKYARYKPVRGDNVEDENLGSDDTKLSFPRLRPRLSLKREGDFKKDDVYFPLVKINYSGGVYNLPPQEKEFIPPCLAVNANSDLRTLCVDAVNKLRKTVDHLMNEAQSPAMSTGLAMLLENRTMLQGLIAQLFYFEAVLYSEVTHPYQLYLALCSLAGHVAGISANLGNRNFPPKYNHDDLRASFEPVTKFIEEELKRAVSISYKDERFEYEGGIYSLQFQAAWKQKRLVIGLRGHSAMTETDLLKWGEDCLIAPEPMMHLIRENRTLGANRKPITREGDLVQTRGMVLFALPEDSEYLMADTKLQILNPGSRTGDLQPSEIILYILESPKTAPASAKASAWREQTEKIKRDDVLDL